MRINKLSNILLLTVAVGAISAIAQTSTPANTTGQTLAATFPATNKDDRYRIGFQDALEGAAQTHAPGLHQRMPSGAGHDAQILAQIMPSAMLFVPSIGGISHHYSENTSDADIVLGCQVFTDAAASIMVR